MTASEASTVSYTASLPLSWQAISPESNQSARQFHANIVLLRGLAAMEAAGSADGDHERETPQGKVLERLETKIDIALSLLARFGMEQLSLPSQSEVTLGVQFIEWDDAAPPQVNQEIALTVYLSPKLPEPLVLNAKVISVLPTDKGFHCLAEFSECDEEFIDWMTRTVFRYHRRALQARRQ